MRSYAAVVVTCVLLAAQVTVAHGCGYCIEDKVAATYDHAVVTRALDRGHNVVFVEVVATELVDKAQWRYLIGTVGSTAGVRQDSIRTSAVPAALSFVSEKSGGSPEQIVSRLNGRLQKQRLKLGLIRVLSAADLKPGVR